MKNTTNNSRIGNGLGQLIGMGKYIWHKCVELYSLTKVAWNYLLLMSASPFISNGDSVVGSSLLSFVSILVLLSSR